MHIFLILINQQILKVDVPISSLALQSFVEASSGLPEHGWEFGWSLASTSQTSVDGIQKQVSIEWTSFLLRIYLVMLPS